LAHCDPNSGRLAIAPGRRWAVSVVLIAIAPEKVLTFAIVALAVGMLTIAFGLVMAVTGREIIQWRLPYMGDYRPPPERTRHAGVVVVLLGIGDVLLGLGIYQALANVAAVASFVVGILITFSDPTLRAGPHLPKRAFLIIFPPLLLLLLGLWKVLEAYLHA
jgi:hypothetical protein